MAIHPAARQEKKPGNAGLFSGMGRGRYIMPKVRGSQIEISGT